MICRDSRSLSIFWTEAKRSVSLVPIPLIHKIFHRGEEKSLARVVLPITIGPLPAKADAGPDTAFGKLERKQERARLRILRGKYRKTPGGLIVLELQKQPRKSGGRRCKVLQFPSPSINPNKAYSGHHRSAIALAHQP
jgi:hypothetical protein